MAPVRSLLQQHLSAAEAAPPGSADEAEFRQQVLPQLHSLLDALQQLPAELLKAVEDQQQQQEAEGQSAVEKASMVSFSKVGLGCCACCVSCTTCSGTLQLQP
jgi:hypothetical protein